MQGFKRKNHVGEGAGHQRVASQRTVLQGIRGWHHAVQVVAHQKMEESRQGHGTFGGGDCRNHRMGAWHLRPGGGGRVSGRNHRAGEKHLGGGGVKEITGGGGAWHLGYSRRNNRGQHLEGGGRNHGVCHLGGSGRNHRVDGISEEVARITRCMASMSRWHESQNGWHLGGLDRNRGMRHLGKGDKNQGCV